jgi:hypothetical protein
MLEQGQRQHDRTCGELPTVSLVLWRSSTDLGVIPNWGAVGNDRSCELVYWMHNYLAEHAEAAIYRMLKRW